MPCRCEKKLVGRGFSPDINPAAAMAPVGRTRRITIAGKLTAKGKRELDGNDLVLRRAAPRAHHGDTEARRESFAAADPSSHCDLAGNGGANLERSSPSSPCLGASVVSGLRAAALHLQANRPPSEFAAHVELRLRQHRRWQEEQTALLMRDLANVAMEVAHEALRRKQNRRLNA